MRRLLPILILLILSDPAGAAAPRSATIRDGVDRTVSYDVAEIEAVLDHAAGRLTLTVKLHRPFPTVVSDYHFAGVSIGVKGAPWFSDNCTWGSTVAGSTSVIIEPRRESPTAEAPEIHVAEVRVSYRDASVDLPVTFSPDRRVATVVIEDNLLRKADLRCLDARATGRGARDASLPQGGPVSDDLAAVFFKGYSPQEQLRRRLRRCNARYRTNARRRLSCRQRARRR